MSRDPDIAAAELMELPLAAETLRLLQAAEAGVRELEARKPEVQHLLIGVAGAHRQLETARREFLATVADNTTAAVNAAMQAFPPQLQAAGNAAADMAPAAGAAAQAAVADVARLLGVLHT